ncbi:MAG: Rieske family iron-sulfur cluster-binding protein [Gammaproteobacteria bacterium]|nr:Rieske 2Fe-2S domain-containing protein [Gammaproteobacteria bacterium]PCH65023.1 MAG: Rieske family iron-sulfur cluster-binding protein [Gammaproteobacteria bacterium]
MIEDHWHIACPSTAVVDSPFAVVMFSQYLVLFRDEQGKSVAVEDRCAHRNMPLHLGKIVSGCIQCPYHGWSYQGNGELTHVPADADNDLICKKIKINAYPCIEQDGYIWVCLSKNVAVVQPPRFPNVDKVGWVTFRMENIFNSSVENCLENFLDIPHATFVHRFLFRSNLSKSIAATVYETEDGAVAEFSNEPREKSLVFKVLSSAATALKHTDRFIAPSMSRVDYIFSDNRHYMISSFCTPVDDVTTKVFTVVTYKYKYFGLLVRLIFEPLAQIIIAQDVKTLRAQQENVNKFGGEKFISAPQDLMRRHILTWREAMRHGKKRVPDKKKKIVNIRV